MRQVSLKPQDPDPNGTIPNRGMALVGGVAQCLERRSLTGELSLIYA